MNERSFTMTRNVGHDQVLEITSIPALRRPRDPDRRKQDVLRAALELFAEKGFDGTSVPDVARRARVAAGTIYRYFANKEELVNAVYQRWKADLFVGILDEFPVTD